MAEQNEPTPEFKAWYEEFIQDHKYAPEDDPDLLSKGLSPQEAIQEHWKAKEFGQKHFEMTGNKPTYEDYRHGQERRYSKSGELISGFGGMPPEEWDKLMAENVNQGPVKPKANLASGFSTSFVSKPMKTKKNGYYNNGF
jgi:hypothetical protein